EPDTSVSFSFKDLLIKLNEAKWALLIPVIILGGIYGGIFSPTEAAVVAVVYAIIVGVFIYRELSMSDLYECFRETVTLNAINMIVISLAIMMSYIMTSEQIPALVGEQLTNISENPIIILLIINLILLIVGMFFDTISAI